MTQPQLPFSETGTDDSVGEAVRQQDPALGDQQERSADGSGTREAAAQRRIAERLMITPPSDDVGAVTLDRYYFQAQCAARECLTMLTERTIVSVVCEHHEDYVVLRRDFPLELVSVKHREAGGGPWTLPSLCDDGGLAHLFDRWVPLRGAAHARLCTNAGVRGGAAALRNACAAAAAEPASLINQREEDREERLQDAVHELATVLLAVRQRRELPGIPSIASLDYRGSSEATVKDFLANVRAFLAVLHLDVELPSRTHMREVNIAALAIPALRALQRDVGDADTYYDAVVDLVINRSRDRGGGRLDAARFLAEPLRFAADMQLRERVAQRTISRPDVITALHGGGHGGRLLPDEAVASRENQPAGSLDLLERKMRAGGLGPTAVSSARTLREAWQETWAARRLDLPGDAAERFDLEARVLELAHQAESEARQQAGNRQYGMAMAEGLRHLLVPANLETRLALLLDRRHLLGLAYELCGHCRIWFSDDLPPPEIETDDARSSGPSPVDPAATAA